MFQADYNCIADVSRVVQHVVPVLDLPSPPPHLAARSGGVGILHEGTGHWKMICETRWVATGTDSVYLLTRVDGDSLVNI